MKFDQIPCRRTVEDAGPYKEIDSFVFSMKVYQIDSVHLIRHASRATFLHKREAVVLARGKAFCAAIV